jgi:beta-ribofuranosylaminobenzene 5'-phosphate synthase
MKDRLSNWFANTSEEGGSMIEVRACARLHLGLLDNNGEEGRLYGSMGVALNHPQLLLRAETADGLQVEGLEIERVAAYAQRFIDRHGFPAGARLTLSSSIPAHVGLGSGTQIALAVGTALARLACSRLNTQEIALSLGRGARSGVGIATFQYGGFVLDGGHRILSRAPDAPMGNEPSKQIEDKIPPLLVHHPVPKDWIFVVAIPGAEQGFSGDREESALLQLPNAPSGLVEKISRLLLMRMLPALVEKDIANFGKALTGIQRIVGDCFAPVQGGRYATPLLEKMVEFLLDKGAAGAGQSSWGPAIYGLVEGKAHAHKLAQATRLFLADLGGGAVFCAQPRNRGARIRKF